MNMKKALAMMTAAAMLVGSAMSVSAAEFTHDDGLEGTKITFLNSKGEIQSGLEDMAATFEEETGISVEILACGSGEVPYTKITSMYNSGTAPTMAMLDTTDIVALSAEKAIDLSDEAWIKDAGEMTVPMADGKIYSFPFCVEGRGIIYNKTAIEDTLGTEFDPSTINSYDSLKQLLEDLVAGGMEKPVVISKEDWSLGAHQLGYIYDTYDGTTAGSEEAMAQLKDGSLKAADYERFQQFTETFDLLKEYNINGEDPLGALYEQDPIYLVDGESALWLNGSWAWPNLSDSGAEATEEYGFIPFVLGNDTEDFANTSMQAGSSKQVMIDKTLASEEEIAAAKEFLNWIVYSEAGQTALVEGCAVVPAFSNNTVEAVDPLGKDLKNHIADGKIYTSMYVAPSDHWSVLGASMQKYLADEIDAAGLAEELDAYWTAQK